MPTSTAIICPKCSKVSYLAGDSSDLEKKCNACGAQLVQPPKQQKVCVVCGKDITSRRRMKDRQGRYFCYECGIADNKRKEQSESYPCTSCRRPFTKDKMIERDGIFFCKRCYGVKLLEWKEQQEKKGSDGKPTSDAKKKQKKLVQVSIALIVVFIFMLYQLKIIKPETWFTSSAPPATVAPAAQTASAKQKPSAPVRAPRPQNPPR